MSEYFSSARAVTCLFCVFLISTSVSSPVFASGNEFGLRTTNDDHSSVETRNSRTNDRQAKDSEKPANLFSGSQPNIVLVNLDDADCSLFTDEMLERCFPNIKRLASEGIRFSNVHATTPYCGPSRAALFRGQYAHNTGVLVNIPEQEGFTGSFTEFFKRGHHKDELGVWMKNAGYRTMHVGKYHHHGYNFVRLPGWDDFFIALGNKYHGTFRFNSDKKLGTRKQRLPRNQYLADVEGDDMVRLLNDVACENGMSDQQKPFLLYYAPFAPHQGPGADPSTKVDLEKYCEWMDDLEMPLDPDWNEADVSDKPKHLQVAKLAPFHRELYKFDFICRARAIKSVDEQIGRVLDVLESNMQLANTYIILTSDNGYQLGHHRMCTKMDPFDRTTRVPLIVRPPTGSVPSKNAGKTFDHLIAHIDICPTILELGNAKIPSFVDAKSFRALIDQPTQHVERTWQNSIMIENWAPKKTRGMKLYGQYRGLRFFDSVYVEWGNGGREFYDLDADPYQLENAYQRLELDERSRLENQLKNFDSKDSSTAQANLRDGRSVASK